jgi:hypothetical protein
MEDRTNTEIEIGDVESYSTSKDGNFSHQSLVMITMRKALETGSKEMRAGWFDYKTDRNGNTLRIYQEDTRESFISAIESCVMIMICDLDEEAEKDLEEIYNEVETIKTQLITREEIEWNTLNHTIRTNLQAAGKGYIKGYFNKDKRFYQMFLEEKLKLYREIFKVLTRQTKRIDFYEAETFEA